MTQNLKPRGLLGTWRALRWSLNGLRAAWVSEESFRLEVCIFLVLGPVGMWLGEHTLEKLLLTGSILIILVAELFNSAIETVIERYGNEFHTLSGRAKDMGSAAVLLLICNAVVVWAAILWPWR